MAGDDENIRIRAELEGALARDARRAADAIDEIGDEAIQTAAQLEIMEAAMRGSARSSRDFGDEQRKITAETSMFSKGIDRNTASVRKLGLEMGHLDDRMEKLRKKKFDLGKVLKLFKLPAIIAAVGALVAIISALGAASVASVAGLAPLVNLIALLPAGVLAAVQGFAALKVGLSGIGDGVKAVLEGDPAKIAEAFANMGPAAQQLTKELAAAVKGPLGDLKTSVQETLTGSLSSGLAGALTTVPVLNQQLTQTSAVLGGLAVRAGQVMSTPLFQNQLAAIMGDNNRALAEGGVAAGLFVAALLNVVEAFGPTFVAITQSTRAVGEFLRETSAANLANGDMAAGFERAWSLAKDVGQVLADLTVGLFNVGKASAVMGDMLGGSLMDGAAAFREWTGSIEGQASLSQWFSDAIPTVQAVGRLLKGLGVMFADIASSGSLVPLLDSITTELLPALTQLTQSVGGGLGPAIVAVAAGFAALASAISFSPVAAVLQAVGSTLEFIGSVVSVLPGPVKTLIGSVLALALAMKVMSLSGTLVARAFSPLTGVVTGWTGQAVTRADAATRSMTKFEKAGARAKAVMTSGGAGSGFLGALGGPWGIAITAAIAGLAAFAGKQAEARAQVDSLKASLDAQTGALTDGSYASVVDSLGTKWLDYAADAGVSQDQVVAAVLEGEDAVKSLTKQIEAQRGTWGNLKDDLTDKAFYLPFGDTGASDAFRNSLLGVSSAMATATDEAGREAAARRQGAAATSAATAGNNQLATSASVAAIAQGKDAAMASQAAAAHRAAASGANAQTGAMYRLNSAAIGGIKGMIGFKQAIADTAANLQRGAGKMNLNTQAGRDNQTAMIAVAEAAASVGGSAKRQQAALETARRKIAGWADQAGYGTKAAQRYADRIINLVNQQNKIPAGKNTRYTEQGLDSQRTKVAELVRLQRGLTDKEVIYRIRTIRTEERRDATRASQTGVGGGVADGPANRFGGNVGVGRPTRNLVGEAGAELFVPRGSRGVPHLVGVGGPERVIFPDPGYIVPNNVLTGATAATDAKLPTAVLRALDAGAPRPAAAPPPPPPSSGGGVSLADLPDVKVDVHIDGSGMTPAEVKAMVKAAVAEALREERERRIAWSDA